jgi:poly(3-hydroxybutyrate) depolymerase
MRKTGLFFLLALFSAAASAAAKPEKQTFTFEGKERVYYSFAPEKLAAPAPLLLLLHGSGRDGMSQINEWKDLAGSSRSCASINLRPIRHGRSTRKNKGFCIHSGAGSHPR